ncbi:3-hydroxybutyryl-CoA dehydrogenase [Streptomyces angustmyceticus]|uniref:3-hydroxybutyryl-CoA dehydrogenase n=1 Tax=Streptomyces angustmyceticus TaxID=285578 RepID=A0A5J4LDB4_9ACTN|nr:3-hydroxybutyryl-CoA dehydrogenase [Streptomyces angustmyceticus]UAL65397.1 3-hydroxybutyryl-CoA dehydrogenase [Streptomyces angustmyceticus]GES28105.1 3-hydroxybutyryl-CoA dehydrogenase [Streptomyces angustmyceticus]
MSQRAVETVGVVGCGLMGSGIAEVCARAGREVHVVETGPAAADAGLRRITGSLERAPAAGRLSAGDRDAALARITVGTDLAALADRDLVVEAVAEDERAKLAVFTRLDEVVRRPDAILATNTSSLPVIRLAAATARPQQVIGLHFFNPVPVLPLVELVPSLLTGDDTVRRTHSFAADVLGKDVVRAADRAGFLVNALLVPYLLDAVRMAESGAASADDIDRGMRLGCAHPLGPLALADLIGLDTTRAIAESLYEEFREPRYAPPPLLSRMVDAGLLGRKSGRGFHSYP